MSSASDRAYEAIRTMILSGELTSGTQIREEALAARCGVSRTPVRDALRRLETELFIRRSDTQRSFVSDWSPDDIEQAFELRGMLESHAAHRAAERIDAAQLAQLKAINLALHRAVTAANPDVQGFLAYNRRLHDGVIAAARSPRLTSMLSRIVEQPIVWRTVENFGFNDLLRSHREHEELLAALERHDSVWAGSVMASHIRRAFHTYVDADRRTAAAVCPVTAISPLNLYPNMAELVHDS